MLWQFSHTMSGTMESTNWLQDMSAQQSEKHIGFPRVALQKGDGLPY